MKSSLNYSKKDPKFKLLEEIFEIVNDKKILEIISRSGIKNRSKALIFIKIILMNMFFDYELSKLIDEINRDSRLKKFIGIEGETPNVGQVYEFMSRHSDSKFEQIVNAILKQFHKPKRTIRNTYIVDATPVACDINIVRKYVTKEKLEKLKLKFAYSTTKGNYIGFKLSVVLDKENMVPVAIFIHNGAPHDSSLFEPILKELSRRRIIKKGDLILWDRGYYSYKNYQIGINIHKIVPIIFPRSTLNIGKLDALLSVPLDIYKSNKKLEINKKQLKSNKRLLLSKLKDWKNLKPIRGIIEDFFKAAKGAFGLGVFHSYTAESMRKNIYLCVLLTSLTVQCGFNTKTRLQQLAEGIIDFSLPKNKSKKKKEKTEEISKAEVTPYENQTLDIFIDVKEAQTSLENF